MGADELTRIERWNLLIAGVFVLVGALFFDQRVAVGLAVGSVLAVVNFWGMRRLIVGSMRASGPRRAVLQLLLIFKMGILFVLIFLAMRFLPLNPIGLAVGLSVFLISIAIESIRFALTHSNSDGAHDGRA